jgi:hypothetical protein
VYRELQAQASVERNPRAEWQYPKAKEEAKNVDWPESDDSSNSDEKEVRAYAPLG